jgi:hypothetical protein
MAKAGYSAGTEGVVALAAAATAKTIFGVKADTGHAIDLKRLKFNYDGIDAAQKPILVELCSATFATNAPGTNSTTVTVDPAYGPRIAETFAAAKNWTAEPTALVVLDEWEFDPYKGSWERDYPLGESFDFAVSEGFVVRMTIPTGGTAVNARVGAVWERV